LSVAYVLKNSVFEFIKVPNDKNYDPTYAFVGSVK